MALIKDLKTTLCSIEELYVNKKKHTLRVRRQDKGFVGFINEDVVLRFRTRKDVRSYIKRKEFRFKEFREGAENVGSEYIKDTYQGSKGQRVKAEAKV